MIWSTVLPPFQGPDEYAHYVYVQHLGEDGKLPSGGSSAVVAPEIVDFAGRIHFFDIRFHPDVKYRPEPASAGALSRHSPDGNSSSGGYPPGYYALAALGYRAAHGDPIEARLHAARLASALLSPLTALAAWLLGRALFGGRTAPIALALIAGLQPMGSMLGASVNNDALLIPVAAAAIALAFAAPAASSRLAPAALGVLTGLGLLSKPQMVFVGPAALAIFLLRGRRTFGERARACGVAGGAALAVWGWWAALSMRKFGSPFGEMLYQTTGGDRSRWHYLTHDVLSREGLDHALFLWFRSFWGFFGWVDTPLPGRAYRAIALVLVIAAAGLLLAWRRDEAPGRRALLLLTGFVLANLAFLYAFEAQYAHRYGGRVLQGRYLLTALLPIAALLVAGTRALAPRRRAWGDAALAFGAVLLQLVAMRAVLFRYHGVGIRGALAHPSLVSGLVPHALLVAAGVSAAMFALGAAVLLGRLALLAVAQREG